MAAIRWIARFGQLFQVFHHVEISAMTCGKLIETESSIETDGGVVFRMNAE
jgi:hypothetical protein